LLKRRKKKRNNSETTDSLVVYKNVTKIIFWPNEIHGYFYMPLHFGMLKQKIYKWTKKSIKYRFFKIKHEKKIVAFL